MQHIINFLHTLTEPEKLISFLSSAFTGIWAYVFIFFVIFAETGLLIGFFLPGDSLLFTLGVVAGAGHLNIIAIVLVLIAAAIIGDTAGYLLGRSLGHKVFGQTNSWILKKEHLDKTRAFYDKHGGKTIIYARFIPIIRTFAPFVAGIAEMNYVHFLSYNVFGGIGWVALMTFLGYGLGSSAVVRDNFEKVILAIVFISLLPPLIEAYRSRKSNA